MNDNEHDFQLNLIRPIQINSVFAEHLPEVGKCCNNLLSKDCLLFI